MTERIPGNSGKRASRSAASGEPAGTTVEADDVGATVERAEHERDACGLGHVGNRLDAAPGEVEVRDGVLVEDAERVEPLRRAVDVAVVARRGGRDEEHRL